MESPLVVRIVLRKIHSLVSRAGESIRRTDGVRQVPTYSTYEAKARFSEILRQVRAGDRVLITYRGLEVAEIRPIETSDSVEDRLDRLERNGTLSTASRNSDRSKALEPVALRPGALARFLESREPRR